MKTFIFPCVTYYFDIIANIFAEGFNYEGKVLLPLRLFTFNLRR
ncbi:hypothetical protein SAMN06265364_1221 [Prevotella jejuni]|uniref:Uncharacterized protein n=1 Tax=Prevotella jejuni TaxID=1177574 RepID=A0AA94IV28_9BACT|nr:hypothetical protein SAMN06265364_1221 [Prevotella jejuni]